VAATSALTTIVSPKAARTAAKGSDPFGDAQTGESKTFSEGAVLQVRRIFWLRERTLTKIKLNSRLVSQRVASLPVTKHC
jgi:hypothetical protein